MAREPQRRDTGRGPAHWWGCIQGSEPHDGVCCARDSGLRGGEGAPSPMCPSQPPEKGGWGTAPETAEDDPARTWRPLRSCKSRWPGRGAAEAATAAPASGSPTAAGVRGAMGASGRSPAQGRHLPAPKPSSALQEASPQIPCLELRPGGLESPGVRAWSEEVEVPASTSPAQSLPSSGWTQGHEDTPPSLSFPICTMG